MIEWENVKDIRPGLATRPYCNDMTDFNDRPASQLCTREANHDGPHVAHGPGGKIYSAWNEGELATPM